MSATGRSDERGFSLVEALVVLGILGMIAAIGFPAMEKALARRQQTLAAGKTEGALHAARAEAIRTARPVRAEAGIVFYPDGSASGGIIEVDPGDAAIRFSVNASTGAIARAP